MSTPILATKLYIPPPRPKVVHRPHLIERLDDGLHRKLTLIAAPAGFGKTTLVGEWLAATEGPVAWLALDERDNDLNHFLAYFIAAMQTIAVNFGDSVLAMLEAPPPVPTEPLLTTLINEIATLPADFVLVLDDYHVINAQSVDDTLTFLVDHLPPQMHLVITTREEPQLPLARLRVKGQLTELRAADLRFATAEAAEFLNKVMGLNLTADAIAALENRTEGWIAGLQLAALSMQGHNDVTRFVQSFTGSHRFVMDYLVEEILQQQPANVQDFLLRTSILDRLCGPLCDAVLRDSTASGQATLEYLERANLLLVPLDDKRQWYRYHHLFADALQARWRQEQPNQVAGLHRSACDWYEHNNLRADAIRHALAAEDFEQAANLIELEWSVIRRSCFRSPTWLGWVQALPDELVRPRPVLCVGYALELVNIGELEAAEVQMQAAERWLEPASNGGAHSAVESANMVVMNEAEFPSLRALLACSRAYFAQALGDIPGTVRHAQRALALITEADEYPRGMASLALGFAAWTNGDLTAAHQFIADGMTSLQKAGNTLFAIGGKYFLAQIRVAQGRLREASNTYEHSLQLATAQGDIVLQGTADLHVGLSELRREWGDLKAAKLHLRKSQELGELVALPDWPYRVCLTQARIKQTEGDLDASLELLDEAEQLYFSLPSPDVRPVAALRARIWLQQGKLDKAFAWVRDHGLSVADDLSYQHEFEHITLARLLIAQYRQNRVDDAIHEAVELLTRLRSAAEAGDRQGSVIEILILQALAQQAHGTVRTALESLERALTLAEPEGYVRLFVDEGDDMAQLLAEAKSQRIMSDYTNKLLAVFEAEEQKPADDPHQHSNQPLVEPLSERELEVLQLVAQGLSNREISERLFLALDTVKGHNRRIYGKLGVQRRTEAVAKARSLNIISPQ